MDTEPTQITTAVPADFMKTTMPDGRVIEGLIGIVKITEIEGAVRTALMLDVAHVKPDRALTLTAMIIKTLAMLTSQTEMCVLALVTSELDDLNVAIDCQENMVIRAPE